MPKTYAITFAGRRDRMYLLVDTMRKALEAKIVDEWHLWNYARTPEDAAWVDSLEGDGIVVKKPSTIVPSKYEDAYTHYTPGKYEADDVFLKLDDDIVYVDLKGLEHMISFRRLNPSYYIVSANVINNTTCFLVQHDMGLWDFRVDDLITSAEQATRLHASFLEGRKIAFDSVAEISPEFMLNINCICWLGRDLDSVSLCESTSINGDELNLSRAFPKIFGRPVALFGPCVVSHLSFCTQDADMPIPELVEAYAAFSNPHEMEMLNIETVVSQDLL